MRLLLVEDDDLWGEGLVAFLCSDGQVVDWARSVTAADAMLGEVLDAWLVDWQLPDRLDDSPGSTADTLIGPLLESVATAVACPAQAGTESRAEGPRFVWQLARHDPVASVRASASGAPHLPLVGAPAAGYTDVPAWHVYGCALGQNVRMRYVAQSQDERAETRFEMVMTVSPAHPKVNASPHG